MQKLAGDLSILERQISGRKRSKVGIFVTHPVQYHVCLWRGLAADPAFDVKVYFFSEQGVSDAVDPGFGRPVTWDVPLLEGYESTFLARESISRVDRCSIENIDAFLAEQQFDLVFLHGYTHRYARQLIRRRKRFRYNIVLRGEFTNMPLPGRRWWKDLLKQQYLKWFYGRVDHFCPIGLDGVDHLRSRGISDDRMTITPYSIDSSLIEQQRKEFARDQARSSLGLSDDQVMFVFSGKLIPRKQPLLLAEAAKRFADDSRFVLCYLGSGELAADVESALRPSLGERLIMPGFVNQSELGKYFSAADVFVLPTSYDTWGLVVNEAMQWGLPCIVSNRTGCRRDLVLEGETGYIHQWDDVSDLAERMKLFMENKELSAELGLQAEKHIVGYNSSVTVDCLKRAMFDALDQAVDLPAN